jgi:hypothetical protein
VVMDELNRTDRSESESAEEEFGMAGLIVFLGVGEVP